MYENAFRAHCGQSLEINTHESAKLYADFARIAAKNPNAWSYRKPPATEKEVATVSKRNRMICSPCKFCIKQVACSDEMVYIDPLLMNAFNTVNMASACLITSTDYAKKIGIPESKWAYVLGGAGTRNSLDCMDASPRSLLGTRELRLTDCSLGASQLSSKSLHIAVA